jgi:hypothetical protein
MPTDAHHIVPTPQPGESVCGYDPDTKAWRGWRFLRGCGLAEINPVGHRAWENLPHTCAHKQSGADWQIRR